MWHVWFQNKMTKVWWIMFPSDDSFLQQGWIYSDQKKKKLLWLHNMQGKKYTSSVLIFSLWNHNSKRERRSSACVNTTVFLQRTKENLKNWLACFIFLLQSRIWTEPPETSPSTLMCRLPLLVQRAKQSQTQLLPPPEEKSWSTESLSEPAPGCVWWSWNLQTIRIITCLLLFITSRKKQSILFMSINQKVFHKNAENAKNVLKISVLH